MWNIFLSDLNEGEQKIRQNLTCIPTAYDVKNSFYKDPTINVQYYTSVVYPDPYWIRIQIQCIWIHNTVYYLSWKCLGVGGSFAYFYIYTYGDKEDKETMMILYILMRDFNTAKTRREIMFNSSFYKKEEESRNSKNRKKEQQLELEKESSKNR